MTPIFKYPHISHIVWLGGELPRDDKLMQPSDVAELLRGDVVIEEKLDGANLGFSIGPTGSIHVQNRGTYLSRPFTGQFFRLNGWLKAHESRFQDGLGESLVVFGEWCVIRHSIQYEALSDWWLMFDVYDRSTGRFWSTARRDQLANLLGVEVVPCIMKGPITIDSLKDMSSEKSRFSNTTCEGLIVRQEDSSWLLSRGKVVRADFIQTIDYHWRERIPEMNQLSSERWSRSDLY